MWEGFQNRIERIQGKGRQLCHILCGPKISVTLLNIMMFSYLNFITFFFPLFFMEEIGKGMR